MVRLLVTFRWYRLKLSMAIGSKGHHSWNRLPALGRQLRWSSSLTTGSCRSPQDASWGLVWAFSLADMLITFYPRPEISRGRFLSTCGLNVAARSRGGSRSISAKHDWAVFWPLPLLVLPSVLPARLLFLIAKMLRHLAFIKRSDNFLDQRSGGPSALLGPWPTAHPTTSSDCLYQIPFVNLHLLISYFRGFHRLSYATHLGTPFSFSHNQINLIP